MPADDPAMTDSPAAPDRRARRRRATDITVTVVLLLIHGVLFGATVAVLSLLVMDTDSCAYRACGDPAWIDRAMGLGLGVGAVVFVGDLITAIWRLARHRLTFFVPLIGCAAQLGLGVGAALMESLAGPV